MRLVNGLQFLDKLLRPYHVFIKSLFFQASFNLWAKFFSKIGWCSQNIIFYNIHKWIKLSKIILHRSSCQDYLMAAYIKIFYALSHPCIDIFSFMSLIDNQNIEFGISSKIINMLKNDICCCDEDNIFFVLAVQDHSLSFFHILI